MWLISSPILGAMFYREQSFPRILDLAALLFWIIGFIFETGGDLQLARFRSDPANRGKVLDTGLWKYTRHPNYFGDSAVWWGYGLFCLSAGSILPALGSVVMTALIIKVSGVALLERSLSEQKPQYRDYIEKNKCIHPVVTKKEKIILMKSLQINDNIPSFILPDQDGKLFNSADYTGSRKMVIFFYPKDDSPGCTKEACYFRDSRSL